MKPSIRNWITGILVLVALAGLASFARGTAEQQAASEIHPGPSFEEAQIQEMRDLLAGDAMSEAGRQSVEDKLAMAERIAAERQESQKGLPAGPRAKILPETMRLAPRPMDSAPLPEGIFEGSEGLVRPSLAAINNMWQADRGSFMYQAFAGSLPDQPQQGVLIVVKVEADRPTGDLRVYLSPQESGALRILAANGDTLLLQSASGQNLSFDLLNRSYQE